MRVAAFFLFLLVTVTSCTQKDQKAGMSGSDTVFSSELTMAGNLPEGEYPGQYELTEFEELTGNTITFSGNPLFDSMDADVKSRLPENPLVVIPEEAIGQYGGTFLKTSKAPESGTSGNLSLRHVNWVRFDGDLNTIVPNVASEFFYNNDNTELTFRLRKGIRWSDGVPLTTDDIMFWYEDIKLNETLYQGDPLGYEIVKIDDYTVKYVFPEPNTSMLIKLASSGGYAQPWQPRHFLEKFHMDYNPDAGKQAKEEGFDSWRDLFYAYYNDWKDSYHKVGVPTIESHVLVEESTEYRLYRANPYYFKVDTVGQQLPYINEIRETFIPDNEVLNLKIIAGEVDLVGQNMAITDYPLLKKNEESGNFTTMLPPVGIGAASVYIFNITHKDPVKRNIFANVKFKQAMSLAMNRDEINERVYLGQGVPVAGLPADPLSIPFITEEQRNYMIEYNPEKAKALLDETGLDKKDDEGFRLRPDGKRLTIHLEFAQQGGPQLIHELIKSYWEDVGIKVEVKEVSSEVFRQRNITNDHDIYTWFNDSTSFPAIASDPQVMYPPWAKGYQRRTGGPWLDYWDSNGTDGEQPPVYIQEWYELGEEFKKMTVGSDEWNAAGEKLVQFTLDNMFMIGTVGYVPGLAVVNNRIKNVPDIATIVWDYYYFYPFRADQFFIEG